MKYCLRNRQSAKYLRLADEIKMDYRDYKSLPDLLVDYPTKKIIIKIDYTIEEVDWLALDKSFRLAPKRLIFCISSFEQAELCKKLGMLFYYGFPIQTFQELRFWIDYGVCYVVLGAPLFFRLPVVKKMCPVPIRAIPNVAFMGDLPYENGLHGTYIRPEDVEIYEPYISVFEFEDCDRDKEQGLYRIYAELKEWPGDLSDIITNFKYQGLNRIVYHEFAERRLNCRQRCEEEPNSCHWCQTLMDLADYEIMSALKEQRDRLNKEYQDKNDAAETAAQEAAKKAEEEDAKAEQENTTDIDATTG